MPENEKDKTPTTPPSGTPAPQAPKPAAPLNVPGSKPNPIPPHERTSQVPIMDRTQQVTPIDPKTGKPAGQPAAPPAVGIVKPAAAGTPLTPAQPAAPPLTPAAAKPAAPSAPAAPATPAADKTIVMSKPPSISPPAAAPVTPVKPAAPATPVAPGAPSTTPPGMPPGLSAAPATPAAPASPAAAAKPAAPVQPAAPASSAIPAADKTVVLSKPPSMTPPGMPPGLSAAPTAPAAPASPAAAAKPAAPVQSAAPASPAAPATPAADKTVVLSRPPSSASASSTAPAAAPAPMSPPPPPPAPSRANPAELPISLGIDMAEPSGRGSSGKGSTIKVAAIAAGAFVLLIGGAWLAVPKVIKSSAETLAKQGRHVDAAKKLQLAASLYPLDRSAILNLLGREHRLSKNYVEAQKALAQALKSNPNDFIALKEMGQAQNEAGQPSDAIATFQRYSEIRPDDVEAVKWIAEISFEQKDFASAAAAYEKFVKAGDASAADWKKLATAQYEQKSYDKSAESFKSALAKNKDLKDVHGYLGMINAHQLKYGDAMAEFKLELALAPERMDLKDAYADAAQKSADMFLSEKKYNEAVAALQDGLTVSTPRDASFHYQLANLFAVRKKRAQALSHLGQAIKADGSLKAKAKRDSAFAQYRALPAFKKLVR